MWFTVTLHSQKLLIGAVYRPPSASSDIFDYLDTETLPTMTAFGAHSVMLVGDFNVHHEDWLGSRTTDAAGRRALQLASCLGLEQIVVTPTRGDQILDLIMTDLPAVATTSANLGTSDHNPVLVRLDLPAYRDKPYKRKVWQYDKANYWGMRGFISRTDWRKVFCEEDPENICVQITEIIQNAMEQFIPSKTVIKKPGDKPWFDENCRKAAIKKRRLFR